MDPVPLAASTEAALAWAGAGVVLVVLFAAYVRRFRAPRRERGRWPDGRANDSPR
jgi:hypothetical protein